MIRRFLSTGLHQLSKPNLKKASSNFLKNAYLYSRFERALPSLSNSFHFKFSSQQQVGLNLDNSPKSPNIIEISTLEEFQKIMKETPLPVIFDCYATWCNPCKKLTPILEDLAKDNVGKWILAKFDIDKIPQLASALKLKSVPTVILIHNGNAVDSFEGLPNEETLMKFMGSVEKLVGLGYSEQDYLERFQEAVNQMNYKNFSEAIQILNKLLESEHWVEKHGAKTLATLSLAHLQSGNKDNALKILEELSSKYEKDLETEEVSKIVKTIQAEFEQKDTHASQLEDMKKDLDADPSNNELRLKIAQFAMDSGIYDQAIEHLLDIMKIDRNFKDRISNKLLIEIFNKLGATNPLVISGRKKMTSILH